jgi:hypothetical protein
MGIRGIATAARVIVFTCLLLSACVKPTAVDELAKSATQAGQLAPGVLSIGYDSCLDQARNAVLASVTVFSPDFHFDQTAIVNTCKTSKQTEERLNKTFQLMIAYIQTLDKLASGNATTFDKSVKSLAGGIPGLSSDQQKAASGLAGLVADAFEKHWRERQAANAIKQAEPDIEVLTQMYEDQIPPFLSALLDNERQSLGSLYGDMAASRNAGTTNPILLTALYSEKLDSIESSKAAMEAFRKVVGDIRTAHKALYDGRNNLNGRDTIQELYQTASDMGTQAATMQKAFKIR